MKKNKVQGNESLARKIKARRNELGLTIEEAAIRAGVGTKTWCRYERGGSIRGDKCKGICKALNWKGVPDSDNKGNESISLSEYKNHDAWSQFLNDNFGTKAAVAFAWGSDILLDHIEEDMRELSSMPAGTHIGQLGCSWLRDVLPEQFLMRYDYEFLYGLKCVLLRMRKHAKTGLPMAMHSVMEELLIYICCQETSVLFELEENNEMTGDNTDEGEGWLFDLFGDEDIITCLYSNIFLGPDHIYHFSHWSDEHFFI